MQNMVFTLQATVSISRDGKAVKIEKSQETCQIVTKNMLLPGNEVYVLSLLLFGIYDSNNKFVNQTCGCNLWYFTK